MNATSLLLITPDAFEPETSTPGCHLGSMRLRPCHASSGTIVHHNASSSSSGWFHGTSSKLGQTCIERELFQMSPVKFALLGRNRHHTSFSTAPFPETSGTPSVSLSATISAAPACVSFPYPSAYTKPLYPPSLRFAAGTCGSDATTTSSNGESSPLDVNLHACITVARLWAYMLKHTEYIHLGTCLAWMPLPRPLMLVISLQA
jgi:hypothetical protein